MLDLQGNVLLRAIGTAACPLFEQIFAHLIACQGALLILAPLNSWILQRLWIEAHKLHTDRCDGADPHETLDPRNDIAQATDLGWGQPALAPLAIVESGFSVACVALPSRMSHPAPLVQAVLDLLPPVRQFCSEDDLPLCIINNDNTSFIAPLITLDPYELYLWHFIHPHYHYCNRLA